jgi:hypothetical protein
MAGFEVIIYGRFWVITEVLLVPTFPAKTQIKCAKEIVRYLSSYTVRMTSSSAAGSLVIFQFFPRVLRGRLSD